MALCPTVRVFNGEDGFKIINESDFDPAVDQLYHEGVAPGVDPMSDAAIDQLDKAEKVDLAREMGLEVDGRASGGYLAEIIKTERDRIAAEKAVTE